MYAMKLHLELAQSSGEKRPHQLNVFRGRNTSFQQTADDVGSLPYPASEPCIKTIKCKKTINREQYSSRFKRQKGESIMNRFKFTFFVILAGLMSVLSGCGSGSPSAGQSTTETPLSKAVATIPSDVHSVQLDTDQRQL